MVAAATNASAIAIAVMANNDTLWFFGFHWSFTYPIYQHALQMKPP